MWGPHAFTELSDTLALNYGSVYDLYDESVVDPAKFCFVSSETVEAEPYEQLETRHGCS